MERLAEARELVERRIERLQDETTLSDRQAEVIAWKSVGATYGEIADEMGVKQATAQSYAERAREKARQGKATWDKLADLDIVE